ncbi:MAG: helix-turn-helix domain-containing protein [Dehalococcoidia bacterium]
MKQGAKLRTDMDLRRSIGERLRRGREEAGVSVEHVSKKLEVSTTTVGHWETGRSFPSAEHLVGLLRLYAIDADWLLGTVPEDMESDEESVMLGRYRLLEPKYRRGIREAARAMLDSSDDSAEQVAVTS